MSRSIIAAWKPEGKRCVQESEGTHLGSMEWIETIKNYPEKFELKDVPYFKTMLGMETDKIQDMLDTIKGNSLPQNLYNKIVSKRGGR